MHEKVTRRQMNCQHSIRSVKLEYILEWCLLEFLEVIAQKRKGVIKWTNLFNDVTVLHMSENRTH